MLVYVWNDIAELKGDGLVYVWNDIAEHKGDGLVYDYIWDSRTSLWLRL